MADDKIASPYTVPEENKSKVPKFIFIFLIVILVILIAVFCYNVFIKDDKDTNFKISYIYQEGVLWKIKRI